jgi:hypothetical protein
MTQVIWNGIAVYIKWLEDNRGVDQWGEFLGKVRAGWVTMADNADVKIKIG